MVGADRFKKFIKNKVYKVKKIGRDQRQREWAVLTIKSKKKDVYTLNRLLRIGILNKSFWVGRL